MKDAYLLSGYPHLVPKTAAVYAAQLKAVKESARRLAEPMKGLKAESPEERAATACLLIYRYKTAPGTGVKTEDVPAAESKLILEGLAGADWKGAPGRQRADHAGNGLWRLGLKEAPAKFDPAEAQKWLKDNAGKHKMTRFAREAGVSEEPGVPAK